MLFLTVLLYKLPGRMILVLLALHTVGGTTVVPTDDAEADEYTCTPDLRARQIEPQDDFEHIHGGSLLFRGATLHTAALEPREQEARVHTLQNNIAACPAGYFTVYSKAACHDAAKVSAVTAFADSLKRGAASDDECLTTVDPASKESPRFCQSHQALREFSVAFEELRARDVRIAGLESSLEAMVAELRQFRSQDNKGENLQSVTVPSATSEEEGPSGTQKMLAVAIAPVAMMGVVAWAKWKIDEYERSQTSRFAPPWYADQRTVTVVGFGCVALWLMVGMYMTMNVLLFDTGDGQHRMLHASEALYLCSQILTTVGYGDIIPVSHLGQGFIACFVVCGVSTVAVLFGRMLSLILEASQHITDLFVQRETRGHGKVETALTALIPCVACIASGTLFFHYWPGEEMPFLKALYFSCISLTTVGFGSIHPVTQAGRLFAAVWMLVGVGSVAQVIMVFSNFLLHRRVEFQVEDLKALFQEGTVFRLTQVDFVRLEFARLGVCNNDEFAQALDKFNDFDVDGDGFVEMDELQIAESHAVPQVHKLGRC